MGRNRCSKLKFVVPALSLLLGSSLLVMGGGQGPEGLGRVQLRPVQIEAQEEEAPAVATPVTGDDCSFLRDPRQFTEDKELRYAMRTSDINRVVRWSVSLDGSSTGIADPNAIARKNFIDDEIFSRMATANIRSAPISSDAEFLRRVTMDLTGRIPSATDVTNFLADTNSNKRDNLIDGLIASPEFTDKWTMFFGDLFQNNVTSAQVTRNIQGRDSFYLYLRNSISQNKPYDLMARELITAIGDGFVVGEANWPIGNTVSMGPAQDTYDGAAVDLGSMFMGINAVDCLLCHDGNHHLDQVNVWGTAQTRQNLWGLSAYFSRTRMTRPVATSGIVVSDVTTGNYNLNTNFGNRTTRPVGTAIVPRYPFSTAANPGSGILGGESYRQAIARQITADIQFSRATVNYIWERLMVEAFVSPSNGFDLARQDPNNPPAAPWTLQPTNPVLLNRLATYFQTNSFNLRLLIGTIAKSSAYQLSSSYSGTWDPSYVPYYARKYVRRMDSEEIADAITKATGVVQSYTFNTPSTLQPVQWAGQLPDTSEPRNNGGVSTFLNAFGRGDRDLNPRRFDGSVLQGLTQMNNTFVTNRLQRTATTGSRVSQLLAQTTDPATIIRQLYLNTMSRPATDGEVNSALPAFQQLGNATAAENLQWVLLNRLQFLFNY